MKIRKINHKTNREQSEPKIDNPIKYFMGLSVIFYGLSLYFPAFGFWSVDKIDWYYGLSILYISPIAWLGLFKENIGVIAVYANYIYAILLLLIGKSIDRKSLLYFAYTMLILSLFSICFRDMGGEISSPLGETIEFWGYGALFWYLSLITISYPIIVYHWAGNYAKLKYFFPLILLLASLVFYAQISIFNGANIQEKELYFDKKVYLTTKRLSGVEFVPIPNIEVNENTVFEFIDNVERKYERDFKKPSQYQYGDNFYIEYPACYGSCGVITEMLPRKRTDYYVVYDFNKGLEYKYSYKLLDNNKKIIWEGQSKYIGNFLYPRYTEELSKLWINLNKVGYKDDEIVRDFYNKNYKNQVFNNKQNCQLTPIKDNTFNLNGKIFTINDIFAEHIRAICSDDYIIVYEYKTSILQISSIYLFDKNTVRPIKNFYFSSRDKIEYLNTKTDHLELKEFYLDIRKNIYEQPIILVKTQMGDWVYN